MLWISEPGRGSDFLFPMSGSQVANQMENTVNWVGYTVYMNYLRRKWSFSLNVFAVAAYTLKKIFQKAFLKYECGFPWSEPGCNHCLKALYLSSFWRQQTLQETEIINLIKKKPLRAFAHLFIPFIYIHNGPFLLLPFLLRTIRTVLLRIAKRDEEWIFL